MVGKATHGSFAKGPSRRPRDATDVAGLRWVLEDSAALQDGVRTGSWTIGQDGIMQGLSLA